MGHRGTGALRQHDARLLQGRRRRVRRLRRHQARHLRGRRKVEERSGLESFASGRSKRSLHLDRQQVRRDAAANDDNGDDFDDDVDDHQRAVLYEQILQRQGLCRMVLLVSQRQHQRRGVGQVLDPKDHRQRQVVAARCQDDGERQQQQQPKRVEATQQQLQGSRGNSRPSQRPVFLLINLIA